MLTTNEWLWLSIAPYLNARELLSKWRCLDQSARQGCTIVDLQSVVSRLVFLTLQRYYPGVEFHGWRKRACTQTILGQLSNGVTYFYYTPWSADTTDMNDKQPWKESYLVPHCIADSKLTTHMLPTPISNKETVSERSVVHSSYDHWIKDPSLRLGSMYVDCDCVVQLPNDLRVLIVDTDLPGLIIPDSVDSLYMTSVKTVPKLWPAGLRFLFLDLVGPSIVLSQLPEGLVWVEMISKGKLRIPRNSIPFTCNTLSIRCSGVESRVILEDACTVGCPKLIIITSNSFTGVMHVTVETNVRTLGLQIHDALHVKLSSCCQSLHVNSSTVDCDTNLLKSVRTKP